MRNLLPNLQELTIIIPAILIVISIHEFAHAYVAHLNGDDTAKNQGRFSLNPLHHIDILGFISMMIVGFGWAKPVPVNPNNFRNYKLGQLTVSLSGIISNIITAILAILIHLKFFGHSNTTIPGSLNYYIANLLLYISNYSIWFAAFNLMPFPPLDGANAISVFLPDNINEKYFSVSRISSMIFMALVLTGAIKYIMLPFVSLITSIINPIVNFLLPLIIG